MRSPVHESRREPLMFSRAYRAAITFHPLLWVTVFLLLALRPAVLLQLLVGFAGADDRAYLEPATIIANSVHVPVYLQTLLRSMWIAARVMIFSLLLGYPLAYYLSFLRGQAKRTALPVGHHSPVGELPGAGLCVEDDSGQRRRAEHAAAIPAPHPRIRWSSCSTVRSRWCSR